MAIIHWMWPPGRCHNCQSIYSNSLNNGIVNVKKNHRSDDERFVLDETIGKILVDSKRNSITSQYSSSDDGGFLPKRSIRIPCSWRRSFVQCPSELSFQSDEMSSNRWILLGKNLLQTVPQLHRPPTSNLSSSVPISENLHINTINSNAHGPIVSSNMYTPTRLSRIHASSPATSSPMIINSPWSPLYFSDLSSVHPSSAERSYLTPQQGNVFSLIPGRSLKNNRRSRYINELHSLRSLQDEKQRMTHGFIPVQIPTPPVKSYYANIGPQFYQPQTSLHQHPVNSNRSLRSRTFPRFNRMLRAPPELLSPVLNLNLNILEQSPESQSSSSGFGSKNTSSHQNHSSQSGDIANEWRLPPYRPPPQPINLRNHQDKFSYHENFSPSSPYSMSHWLELMQRLNLASTSESKAVESVGSVDGHYEFDPSSPTPTASTPTGRDELLLQHQQSNDILGALRTKRIHLNHHQPRYDQSTIDSRVQAMKEEFYAFRKRQAIKRAGIVLESAC